MTHRKFQKRGFVGLTTNLLTVLPVIALLPFLFTGASGFVVCFGQNGHVAVELPKQVCCDSPLQSSTPILHNSSSTSDGCGDCIDVPLFTGDKAAFPILDKMASKIANAKASLSVASYISLMPNTRVLELTLRLNEMRKPSYVPRSVVLLI